MRFLSPRLIQNEKRILAVAVTTCIEQSWLRRCIGFLVVVLLLQTTICQAHESRPAYLELTERAPGLYEVLWRRPALGEQVLALTPRFPARCRETTPRSSSLTPGAVLERWGVTCGESGLAGQTITIDGLSRTITDVLVRVSLAAGVNEIHILRATTPSMTVTGVPAMKEVAANYFRLGVEHIWGGIDHLLFVLGLLALVQEYWVLCKTITAFTIAHSVTLGLTTLGFVHVPQAPVEAVIALSILFLAVELTRASTHEASLTVRYPWIVALSFGLLHGFGFAGALAEVGLPPTDMPLALFMFNVGVEVGQLGFIMLVLLVAQGARRCLAVGMWKWRQAVAYSIGSLAAFWLLQRVVAFF